VAANALALAPRRWELGVAKEEVRDTEVYTEDAEEFG
jgi:hypothetical protein